MSSDFQRRIELMSTADLERAIAAGLRKHSAGALEMMKAELRQRNETGGGGDATPDLFVGATDNYWTRLGGKPA